jgi:hypothetical protein
MKPILVFLFAAICSTVHAQNGITGDCVAAGMWASGIKGQPRDFWLNANNLAQMKEPLRSMHKRFVAIVFTDDNRMNPEQLAEFFTHECLVKNGNLSKMFVGRRDQITVMRQPAPASTSNLNSPGAFTNERIAGSAK